MESIKRSLAVSILARGWGAALALLAVPAYLHFLGIEAYGVVGVFTSFSAVVAFLDLGLAASLIRELARLSGGTDYLRQSRNVACTFEWAYAGVALLICLLALGVSTPVAQHWIKVETLERAEVAHALALAGFALACQWPSNLYSSGLAGLQRQMQLSLATMLFVTLRVLITLVAVWWRPNLESFFWAQIASAMLQTIGFRWLFWRALVLSAHRPTFSFKHLRDSLSFAGDMTAIAVISIILTQADKLILSNALNLTDFGTYIVASTLAAGLYILISPVFLVIFPRLSGLVQSKDDLRLISTYHAASQVLAGMLFPIAAIIVCFPEEILFLWTEDLVLSDKGAPILAFLVLGNTFNGLMNVPYALQLAHGWTRLALWVNLIGLIVLVPSVWWAALQFGMVGGAVVWFLLNLGYFLVWPHFLHQRLIKFEKFRWYMVDVLLPLVVSILITFFLKSSFFLGEDYSKLGVALYLIFVWITCSTCVVICLPYARRLIFGIFLKKLNKAIWL